MPGVFHLGVSRKSSARQLPDAPLRLQKGLKQLHNSEIFVDVGDNKDAHDWVPVLIGCQVLYMPVKQGAVKIAFSLAVLRGHSFEIISH